MLLTKLAELQIIHKADTISGGANMLSRVLSKFSPNSCQRKHKTLPTHIDFLHIQCNNSLKQIEHIVKDEEILPTQNNDSHPTHSMTMVMNNSLSELLIGAIMSLILFLLCSHTNLLFHSKIILKNP